jgi:hypothetical protein
MMATISRTAARATTAWRTAPAKDTLFGGPRANTPNSGADDHEINLRAPGCSTDVIPSGFVAG